MTPTRRITRLQWIALGLIALGGVIQLVGNGPATDVVSRSLMTSGFMWFITWSAIQSVLCPGRIWFSVLKAWLALHAFGLMLTAMQLLSLWLEGREARAADWPDHFASVSGFSFGTTISLLATMMWVGGWKLFRIRLRDRVTGAPITPAKVSLVDLMLLTTVVAIHITVARLQQKWVFEPSEEFLGPGFAFIVVLALSLSAGFIDGSSMECSPPSCCSDGLLFRVGSCGCDCLDACSDRFRYRNHDFGRGLHRVQSVFGAMVGRQTSNFHWARVVSLAEGSVQRSD